MEPVANSDLTHPAPTSTWPATKEAVWAAENVDAVTIATQLERLAFTPEPGDDGIPLVRAYTVALLVRAPDPKVAERAAAVVASLAGRYPGRAVIVVTNTRSRAPRSAASISLLHGMEMVRLNLDGHAPLAEQTWPLWVPGVPHVTWWVGNPPSVQEAQGLTGWLMVDSADFRAPQRDLHTLAELMAAGQVIVDLNWERLFPWRDLIDHWFTPADAYRYHQAVSDLLVEHGRSATAAALLLGGWLAMRQLGESRMADKVHNPAVRIVRRRGASTSLLGVALRARMGANRARFSAQRPGDGSIQSTIDLAGGRHTAWPVPVTHGKLIDALEDGIYHASTDPEYVTALHASLDMKHPRR